MKTNHIAFILAAIGLFATSNVQASFYPQSVSKLCSAVPILEDGMFSKPADYLPYIKCLNAKADYLNNILKETLETAIASVKDADTKEMLQQAYSKHYGNPKQKGKTPNLTTKTPVEVLDSQADIAEDRLFNNQVAIMKILSILYPSKYPNSRFRTQLEKEDLESTFEATENKVGNESRLEAEQKAWYAKRDEFCSSVAYSARQNPMRVDVFDLDEECKNIMNRIRIKELEAIIDKH